jgi:hypothetical protein
MFGKLNFFYLIFFLVYNILNFVFLMHNILNLLKRENVCKKIDFIGELKLGYNRKIKCKNTFF